MRINKYLADLKYSTRRGADELIMNGRVSVNGKLAKVGQMIEEGDKVIVRSAKSKSKPIYMAYHKPRGVVTHSAPEGDQDIGDVVPVPGVFPVGRLDKDSSGLIILSNDGRITDRLLSPKHYHEKEYLVTVKGKLRSNFKAKMEAGVQIDADMTRPCKVEILGDKKFRITLTEGKKHQIRRMCTALFQEVDTLKRIRVMNVKLDDLKEGAYRNIEGEELKVFLRQLGF